MKNPTSYHNQFGQLWLNVGSSSYTIPGFVHLDSSTFLRLLPWYPLLKHFIGERRRSAFEEYRKATKEVPFLTHDCGQPLPFPSASVDHILASHFLEHLFKEDAKMVVSGFFRILKPGGTLHVIVPDLAARARRYVENPPSDASNAEFVDSLLLTKASKPTLLLRWRELVGGFGLLHRWMYDEPAMRSLLERAGFTIESQDDSPSAAWRREDNDWQVNILARKPKS